MQGASAREDVRHFDQGGPIRVLVADDDSAIRGALADLVASDASLELVGAARDAEEAIALAEVTHPRVALIDVRMPAGGGLHVAREIAARSPDTVVVAHTAVDDRTTVVQMLHAGAAGYIVKGTPATEVVRAIIRAARGEISVSPHVMSGLVNELAQRIRESETETEERRSRIDRIESAIRGRGRTVVYQPIVELPKHRLVGTEALSRFASTDERWPVDRWFIEAARLGLGTDLEIACCRDALQQIGQLPLDTYLSVNVSHQTARSDDLLEILDAVDASRVAIEITEHEAVEDYDALTAALRRVRERGTRVAIDDAGAGFASLRHILLIEPEMIKLDVSLTRGIDSDARRKALAAALISFSEQMGMVVVAEGVETQAEHDALVALGVTVGQGYFMGRPMTLDDVLRQGSSAASGVGS